MSVLFEVFGLDFDGDSLPESMTEVETETETLMTHVRDRIIEMEYSKNLFTAFD